MAFNRRINQNERPTSVYIADIDGSNSEKISEFEDFGAVDADIGGWFADGNKLLIGLRLRDDSETSGADGFQYLIGTFDLASKERPAKERFKEIHKGVWGGRTTSIQLLPGGDGIIVAGGTQGTLRIQFWHLSYPEGKLSKITDDANDYYGVTVSPDGKTIASVTESDLVSLWSIDPANQKVRQVKAEQPGITLGILSSMPDGRLIFVKYTDYGTSVYSMNEDGTDEKELFTSDEAIYLLEVSPDGKDIVTAIWSQKMRASNLYHFNADGSDRKQITDFGNGGISGVQITPDGWVLFTKVSHTSRSSNPTEIMKVPLKGGKAEKLAGLEPSQRDRMRRLSPDGKHLAYVASLKDEADGKIKEYLRVTEFSDGKAGKKIIEKQVKFTHTRWLPDSSAIIYEKVSGLGNLFKLDLRTQKETQVSDFTQKADTGSFVWNQDGKNILAFRYSPISNLVLIRDMSGVKDE